MATGRQTWISTIGEMEDVLQAAYASFPETDGKPARAFTRALVDWLHNQQRNSKSASLRRIESEILPEMSEKIDLILRILRDEEPTNPDGA